jgi:diguanylate cyclase (GGDEF)-like protein
VRGRSFQAKLIYLLVGVLVLLQAATLIAVHVAGQRTLSKTIAEELEVGSRVLDRVLASRGRQLSDTVRVLAADFAFREAVASADNPTIASVLNNHGSRIGADVALLISLGGTVGADSLGGQLAGRQFPLPALVTEARTRGEASAIVTFKGEPYQLVIVPVLAPRPIALVCMGFVINEAVLKEVGRLTALDVSLWSTPVSSKPIMISTLAAQQRHELLSRPDIFSARTSSANPTIELGSDAYQTLLHPLTTADNSRINTLLQRSIREAQKPYRRLELQIFALSGIVLLVALIASIVFARGVSRPLQRLSDGAHRIEQGDYSSDYSTSVDLRQQDEIGQLASAFNRMRTRIREREEQIRFQATHDALTGLPNRTLFLDRLEQAIAHARRRAELVGMIMMDLDRFKEINDTLGHHFGDDLLVEIGRRLQETLRDSDTVARLGGDEFAVTFFTRGNTGAIGVAEKIANALKSPFLLGNVSIEVDASMGIALCPLHAEDAGTLMKRADVAMYDAKKNHSSYAIYEPGRDEHSLRRLTILSELRHAIEREELTLHYQPKIHVHNSRAVHAEALVRWRHPVHGNLPPDEFIPLAEQSGNISMITKWVLRRAILDCGAWNASGVELTVAVNLSALDLFDSDLTALISRLLAEAKLPASRLVLEITESALMRDPAYALRTLSELKSLGVSLAIDDYGTGYSSLAHLKRLPVDELKIDKSFVLTLSAASTDDIVIVRSTIELGHNMGLKVIAEGVESAEAWDILKSLGCDMAQGYFVSPPLPSEEFGVWMRKSQKAPSSAPTPMPLPDSI